MLRLNLFGAPAVIADGAPLSGRAVQGRRIALLAMLACTRGRMLRRDRILALLWPESPTERARAQLSDDIYILRTKLGEDVVRSAGDEIALNPDTIISDAEEFERLLTEGQHERAAALVAGPLLDGFHLPDSAEFEQWLDAERARFAAGYATALEALANAAEAAGDAGAAVRWWRRLAAHDPFSSRIALGLMRALDAHGDRADALRHARVHTTLLREELDAAPDPEVTAFADRLRRDPPVVLRPASSLPAASLSAIRSAASTADVADPRAAASHETTVVRRKPHRVTLIAAALALLAIGFVVVRALTRATPGAASPAQSVAVLPFVNLSADPSNAYFGDGLTEQIISTLSRIEGLHVAARTSSFSMRNSDMDVRAIGGMLGVAMVLEGSVRRERGRLRVTAQLIDAATGYHMWTEEYDRQPEDVLDVQAEIAAAIAQALRLRLTPAPRNVAAPDLAAYDFYLRALYLRNTMRPGELGQALEFFDSAIARAPTFALAYAGKASVLAPAILFGYQPDDAALDELRALVDRALELDPTLGEAHASLGIVRLFWDWDWAGAERSLRRAVALNPNDAHAHHHLANYFNVMGELEEAIAARSRSVELDPLNPRTVAVLAGDYLRQGDHARSLELYARAMKLDPAHPIQLGLGPAQPSGPARVFEVQGRDAEAVEDYARIATLRGATPAEVDALRRAFERGRWPAFWQVWLEMDRRQTAERPDPLRAAMLLLLRGDTARALDSLDRAYEQHNPGLVFLGRGLPTAFDGMESHPRVARLLAAMKLPRS